MPDLDDNLLTASIFSEMFDSEEAEEAIIRLARHLLNRPHSKRACCRSLRKSVRRTNKRALQSRTNFLLIPGPRSRPFSRPLCNARPAPCTRSKTAPRSGIEPLAFGATGRCTTTGGAVRAGESRNRPNLRQPNGSA